MDNTGGDDNLVLGLILFFVGLVLNILITFWIVLVKFNEIKRDKTYIQEIRAEMAEFMAALEENVSGYVTLMERMQKDASSVLENVNRKLRLIEKENQKLEQSRQTYNDLVKKKPLVSSVIDIQKSGSTERIMDSTYGNSTKDAPINNRKSLNDLSLQLRNNVRDSGDSHDMKPSTSVEESKVKSSSKIRPSVQIAAMWRDGMDAKEIAEKLNLSMGEVELALELMGSRRS
ncbi:hypothetical protein PVA44_05905 [Entomospira nematocerorum]|uniref:Uncharacterized protein n=1 Tax=Entomospira nematocerorum TaxID=2719987 RepID=A0A968GAS0_9SPIO|nr:hypothetical protein [Entomospira nematocera]NIZ46447.1 hypothetical protein [Entomospira nematocera]WDI33751.1 hypothetical protein PVA44_05905 [Entomospira nematocera]